MIYLDNAATTYPKPTEVINAVNKSLSLYGANPGRSGHNLSINTAMEKSEDKLVCVCGSLYLTGEVRKILGRR